MGNVAWEDMNLSLLLNVFAFVGIKTLFQSIPLVCKSWYKATIVLQPLQTVEFVDTCSTSYMKSVFDRIEGFPKCVIFHSNNQDGLLYISEQCPDLKVLCLWQFNLHNDRSLSSNHISKWKNLEFLHCSSLNCQNLKQILEAINIHCENFVGLTFSESVLFRSTAAAFPQFVPRIKYLSLKGTALDMKTLLVVLNGCRELEYLDLCNCHGIRISRSDPNISVFISNIRTFKSN